MAVETDEDGHCQNSLPGQTILALDFPMHQQIELLLGGTEFDIGFEFHGIECGEQRIEQLVNGNRLVAVEA